MKILPDIYKVHIAYGSQHTRDCNNLNEMKSEDEKRSFFVELT